MVSYPDTAPIDRAALAIRPASRAPSVASTSRAPLASHRRHSRQIRSHAGGSSYQPQNEFPIFTHTGDVEIVITSNPHRRGAANAVSPYGGATAPRREERFLLHRLILAQCSGFFDEVTSDEWSRAQQDGRAQPSDSALARLPPGAAAVDETGRRKRWRFELDWGEHGDEMPTLVQKEANPTPFGGDHAPLPPPVHNKPAAPSAGFFRSMANFSSLNVAHSAPAHAYDPEDDIFRDYANLFRIFYNYPPALDSVNIAQAYVECKTLLHLADMYDALEVIGPRVDHHLLRFQGRLFKQIAKYPPSYLKLGYLARSRVIYSEALIHVVGQWPVGANQLRGLVPQAVLEVIEDKADELEELKTKIETKLFKLTLTTSRGERVTPSNSFIDWLAMSLFRQWLAENTSRPPAPILKTTNRALPNSRTSSRNGPSGHTSNALATTSSAVAQQPAEPPPPLNTGRIFRLIGTGGSAYLGHDELKRFLKLNPEFYTRDNMKKFERRMEELKNLAADLVKPLMRNYLELDMRDLGHGLPYLTCTKVEEQDLVWDDLAYLSRAIDSALRLF